MGEKWGRRECTDPEATDKESTTGEERQYNRLTGDASTFMEKFEERIMGKLEDMLRENGREMLASVRKTMTDVERIMDQRLESKKEEIKIIFAYTSRDIQTLTYMVQRNKSVSFEAQIKRQSSPFHTMETSKNRPFSQHKRTQLRAKDSSSAKKNAHLTATTVQTKQKRRYYVLTS
jgi:hypothetical protein